MDYLIIYYNYIIIFGYKFIMGGTVCCIKESDGSKDYELYD